MPRPGPRPYECIRRAWHSDSHQPLRGALIQEIFRVVNELHGTSTRRKKEWQEKLPIVVLRAEEILYSKANSESEYAGVETLRTRLDDAVNTMIRRDDSEEEGVYLPPCVEAALSLGCTPKKIPRGQRQVASRLLPNGTRHNSPMCANNNGSYRGMAGKVRNEVKSMHDKKTNSSSCGIGAQNSQMSTALPMRSSTLYSSAGPPQGPIACYTPTPGFVFPQNFTLPTSFEASHPSITPSLPQLGGLVQFLKSADPSAHAGLLGPVPYPVQISVNHDSRALQYVDSSSSSGARIDAHFVCRDLNGSMCTTSPMIPPASSIPRSTLEICRDSCDQLVKSNLAGAVAPSTEVPAQKSLISIDTRMTPQMQEIAARPDIFSMNTRMQGVAAGPDISSTNTQMQGFSTEQNRWQTCPVPKFKAFQSPPSSYRPSPLQRSSLTSPISIDVGASSHACVDDLQLRLGPPGSEATGTSVLSGDPSAPKRLRVDHGKHDVSGSNIDQFQLCGLPLSQPLTWSRC